MIAPARTAAYKILLAVSAGTSDLPSAIAAARTSLTDERDRALAAEVATGVQRWRATLDHLIAQRSKRPLSRLDPEIVEILRLSIYQLLHLARVPASAVVDDAVNMAGKAGKRSAQGFVNAVLRGISRQRDRLDLPQPPSDRTNRDAILDYFSVTLSHPRWLAGRWLDRYGFDAADAWMRFNNAPAPLTLRVNQLRTTRETLIAELDDEDVRVRRGVYAPDALIVEEGHPLRGDSADGGRFVVQDEASQLVAWIAGARAGTRVLDTCASPGGKATAMAADMNGTGVLIACDLRPRRVELLRQTIATSGATNVAIVRADVLRPLPFPAIFDLVVLDAPCSGLGTLRRDPDIKWRRQESDLVPLAAAQLTMLQHAADAVAPGGRLVYATCSSEPEENEGVVNAFLAGTRHFELAGADALPSAFPRTLLDERGFLRTAPDRHQLEAFFAAVLRRR